MFWLLKRLILCVQLYTLGTIHLRRPQFGRGGGVKFHWILPTKSNKKLLTEERRSQKLLEICIWTTPTACQVDKKKSASVFTSLIADDYVNSWGIILSPQAVIKTVWGRWLHLISLEIISITFRWRFHPSIFISRKITTSHLFS